MYRFASPGGDRLIGDNKVRLLHLSKHLLIELFVVIGHTAPFPQKRQIGPKEVPHILEEELPLNRAGSELWPIDTYLHVVQILLLKQTRQIVGDPIGLRAKVFSRPIVRLSKQTQHAISST